MLGVERAETTEAGVDDPKVVVAVPCKLVDIDVAGYMNAARQIASVVLPRRLELLRQRRHVAVLPDGIGAADCEPGRVGDDTHGLRECSKVSVEPSVIIADDDGLASLVGRNDQADPQLVK